MSTTETVWKEDSVGITEAGDVGGDMQVGKALSRRFLHTSLYGRMITVTAFVEQGDGTDSRIPEGVIRLAVQTELMICTDQDDPGSTEEWCDYEYSELPERFAHDYAAVCDAEAAALIYLQQLDPGLHFSWDGKPDYGPASVLKYGEIMGQMSGAYPDHQVVAMVQDTALKNNRHDNPRITLDWWYEIVTDPKGNQWRVAWFHDVRSFDELAGGWVIAVFWEPVDPRHTHYSPYDPPRQVPGTLLDCTESARHDAKDSELWADYRYSPRLERPEATGLPGHIEKDVIAAYSRNRREGVEFAITEVIADPEYTYRVTLTNRTAYDVTETGPVFHSEEWGLYATDGEWHGIPKNPHPGYEHWSTMCPNCGY